jgi:hypothetical protein
MMPPCRPLPVVAFPWDSQRMIILSGYWELTGKVPESADPARQNHLALLHGIATAAKLLLGKNGAK